MGRRKIKIQMIGDERLRQVTLTKRKKGLIKKAMELALLTGVNIFLTIYDDVDSKLIQYKSDTTEIFQEISKKKRDSEEQFTSQDYFKVFNCEEEEEEEEEEIKGKKGKNKKSGKQGKVDQSKSGSPSKNQKGDSLLSADKKRMRIKEENIAQFIEADNKKRMKTSDFDADIQARNELLDAQILLDVINVHQCYFQNFKEPGKLDNLNNYSGSGGFSRQVSGSEMRTPSFRDNVKLLGDSLQPGGLNESTFGRSLSGRINDKDMPDKLGRSPEKGVPMHSISNELLSVSQSTIDHYNLLSNYQGQNNPTILAAQGFGGQFMGAQPGQYFILQPVPYLPQMQQVNSNNNGQQQQQQQQQNGPSTSGNLHPQIAIAAPQAQQAQQQQQQSHQVNPPTIKIEQLQPQQQNTINQQQQQQQQPNNQLSEKKLHPLNPVALNPQVLFSGNNTGTNQSENSTKKNEKDLSPNQVQQRIEDFGSATRGLSDFLIRRDEFGQYSRQGSEFFYGIKSDQQNQNQFGTLQNQQNNLINTIGNNNSAFMSVNDSRVYNKDSAFVRQQTNEDLFRVNSAGRSGNQTQQFEKLMSELLFDGPSQERVSPDAKTSISPINSNIFGQGGIQGGQEQFYQQQNKQMPRNFPLIIATPNANGQNNGQPGQVYILKPKQQHTNGGPYQIQQNQQQQQYQQQHVQQQQLQQQQSQNTLQIPSYGTRQNRSRRSSSMEPEPNQE